MLLGHVAQGEHEAADGQVVPQVAPADLEHDHAPVKPLDLEQVPGRGTAGHGAAAGAEGEHQVEHPVDVIPRRGGHQVGEQRALDGDVAEDVGRGRGGVQDPAVVVHDEDHVGGVLHQGAEQRLAALAGHLLGEREPLDGQRRLPGQDLKHRGEVAEGPPVAEEPDKSDERFADGPVLEGERAEQRALGAC